MPDHLLTISPFCDMLIIEWHRIQARSPLPVTRVAGPIKGGRVEYFEANTRYPVHYDLLTRPCLRTFNYARVHRGQRHHIDDQGPGRCRGLTHADHGPEGIGIDHIQ